MPLHAQLLRLRPWERWAPRLAQGELARCSPALPLPPVAWRRARPRAVACRRTAAPCPPLRAVF